MASEGTQRVREYHQAMGLSIFLSDLHKIIDLASLFSNSS